MFLDQATITVSGGGGGRGCVSWRREKYEPKGGPDGGNGGRGGDVYLIADPNTDTLSSFASRKDFAAGNGLYGSGRNKNGKTGDDLWLRVPPGTIVRNADTEEVIVDLIEDGDTFCLAQGGRGGFGNAHFKSATRQRPDFAELGEPGASLHVHLELKLVADVGIIGLPSAGKSTLISVISASKPKIADYPFTTLVPNLGVVDVDDRSFIVCDVPGLIEGASEGKGLGDQFLKHIERCGLLLHMLDAQRLLESDAEGHTLNVARLCEDYRTIRRELERYSSLLAEKKELIVLNKIDLIPSEIDSVIAQLKTEGIHVLYSVSAATTQGVQELKKALLPIALEQRATCNVQRNEEMPVLRPHEESIAMGAYRIEEQEDGSVVIRGKRLEQFVTMTDFNSEGGVKRFRYILEKIGLSKTLQQKMKKEKKIEIAGIEVSDYV